MHPLNMRTTYKMLIRSVPAGEDDPPEIIRLRNTLKMMYRAFGFQCLTISPNDSEFSDGAGI